MHGFEPDLIFPAWVEVHTANPQVAQLTSRARWLRHRRARGNQRLPVVHPTDSAIHAFHEYVRARSVPLDTALAGARLRHLYHLHRDSIAALLPTICRSHWTRWIYLERALEIASQTGDLLFAAVILRTMAEDVWALSELQRLQDRIYNSRTPSPGVAELKAVRTLGDLLWSRFLPPVEPSPPFPSYNPPDPYQDEQYQQLRCAVEALREYLHPLAGSHLMALFPEESRGLAVLLNAYVTIYEYFFQLPWVEAALDEPTVSLPPITVRPLQRELRYFEEHILPELDAFLHRRRASHTTADSARGPGHALLKGFRQAQEYSDAMWDAALDWFDALRAFATRLLGCTAPDEELCRKLAARSDLGIPPWVTSLFQLAHCRRLAMEAASAIRDEREHSETDLPARLRVCARECELLYALSEYKISALNVSLLRQLNDRNPLAATLAMGSLIEHHAILREFGASLRSLFDRVVMEAADAPGNPAVWRLLREETARFLGSTRGNLSDLRWWLDVWSTPRGVDPTIGRTATKRAFGQHPLTSIYDFAESAAHGHRARPIELCPPTDKTYVTANLFRASVVAVALDSPTCIFDRSGAASVVAEIEALRHAVVADPAETSSILRTVATGLSGQG